MTANDEIAGSVSLRKRRARKLRQAAVIVLLLGILSVGAVYWIAAGSGDPTDETMLAGYYKSTARQVEQLYGQQGLLVEEWTEDLKRPGPQACIIIIITAVISGGCYYLARLSEHDGGKTVEERRSQQD